MKLIVRLSPLILLAASPALMAGAVSGGEAQGPADEAPTLTVMLPGDVEMELCRIPAGRFLMGSPDEEQDREPGEGPQHGVTISRPFYLGTYEVTHAQWKAVTGSTRDNSGFDGSNYDSPMQATSWNEVQGFLEQLNALGLGTFRLPTEAEWEYAARAGTTSRFYWGDDPEYVEIDDYAWYDENAEGEAHDAGEKEPNAWGLYDMSGNAWEWCEDWYGPYSGEDQVDPRGPENGTTKVFRGGEWFNPPEKARSAYRGSFAPDSWLYFGGLRVVKEIPE